MTTPDDLIEYALLADLTHSQLEQVAAVSNVVGFARGSTIIEEGRDADRCWLISAGTVRLETRLPNGRSAVLQTLGQGDVLGWSWLMPPYRWRFDAAAIEAVIAIEIDAVQLRLLAEEDPALGYAVSRRLVEVLADRLHGARARLLDIYRNPRAD